jgi:hypothetical protein
MWVGWESVQATSTPFTVTMFWVILPGVEKMAEVNEVWELGKVRRRTHMVRGEKTVSLPRSKGLSGSDINVTNLNHF